jgi:hypothetical protein
MSVFGKGRRGSSIVPLVLCKLGKQHSEVGPGVPHWWCWQAFTLRWHLSGKQLG